VAIADFNNDTRLDILVVNSGDFEIAVHLGYANEAFVKKMTLTTGNGSRPRSLAIVDFNNDGRLDIGIANSGTNNVGIFLGYGNGSFANQLIYSIDYSPWSVVGGDFNHDTIMDIAVTDYANDNVAIYLGCGNGTFVNHTKLMIGSQSKPYAMAVIDFNNDTFLDIIVANYGSNNVDVFLGFGDGTFADALVVSIGYGYLPFSIVVGDFNNDRKPDFAVGNQGTDNLNVFLQTCSY
jgi:hypothetical protein